GWRHTLLRNRASAGGGLDALEPRSPAPRGPGPAGAGLRDDAAPGGAERRPPRRLLRGGMAPPLDRLRVPPVRAGVRPLLGAGGASSAADRRRSTAPGRSRADRGVVRPAAGAGPAVSRDPGPD